MKSQKRTAPDMDLGDPPIKEEAPDFYIPTLAKPEERENSNEELRVLRSQNEKLQAQNTELQENFEQSERGLVLVVEALSCA